MTRKRVQVCLRASKNCSTSAAGNRPFAGASSDAAICTVVRLAARAPTTEPSEGVEPSTEPSTEPSPDPTWSTAPGSGKGDDGNEVDDQGEDADHQGGGDADHQAGGDDGHEGTDDSHHGDGGSPSPSPEPSETSGDHQRG